MSLQQFDHVEENSVDEDNPQQMKSVRQTKNDIRKTKINLRQSQTSVNDHVGSIVNLRSKIDIRNTQAQIKSSKVIDLGLYQANPEDVWTPQEHAEAIKYIHEFIKASKIINQNLPIYEEIKEYAKTRKNRQLLILNDFHLYLRDAYKSNFDQQQIILETIYQISLEKDFCDELALLGGLIDEAFVFLQTHLKIYNKQVDYSKKQDSNIFQTHDVEIIDTATLLKLDLWIRIANNFSKNDEVLEYISLNKEDVIKYLLIFLQNIDNVIKNNSNLSSINSIVIASTVKTGVLDILFLLTQLDDMRNKVIFNESYFSAIYNHLLKKTTNLTIFSSLCKLISQLALSEKFPIHIFGVNIIEDFIFSYMMRIVFNVGITDEEQEGPQNNWNSIKQERLQRQNFQTEVGLARTFFYLTVNSHQRQLLMISINEYEDNILIIFMLECFQKKQYNGLIYMILGLNQLIEKEQLMITKDYQRKIILFIYQDCDQIFIDKESTDEKIRMLITILMTRLVKLINFKNDEMEKVLELMNGKINNQLKIPNSLPFPQLDSSTLLTEMRKKKLKKYEEKDKRYKKQIMGYDVQGIEIKDRPYGDSVNYSKLISDMSEGDFNDSLLENEIFHLRKKEEVIQQQTDFNQNYKNDNISKRNQDEKHLIFNFEKKFYPQNLGTEQSQGVNQQGNQEQENSFLQEQMQIISEKKSISKFGKPKQIQNSARVSFGNSYGQTPMNANGNNQLVSFNVSSIKNQNNMQDGNSQSDDYIRDDIAALNQQHQYGQQYEQEGYNQYQGNTPSDRQFGAIQQRNSMLQNKGQGIRKSINNDIVNSGYDSKQSTKKEQPQIILYMNDKKQCFRFHRHYKRRCEYCLNIFYSFFDQANIDIEQWIFNQQNGLFDEVFKIDFFYENFIQIIHSLFYFSMNLKGELPQNVLKQLCIVLANQSGQYSDRRYKAAVIMLISHITQINPSYITRLIQINFLCVQDFVLTQFLNCFGYKTFSLLKLIKRGTGTVNRNPIFEQVQRRGSKLSTLQDEDEDKDEERDNVYENLVIQSTLLMEFDGVAFNINEVTLSTKQSEIYIKENQDKEYEEPDNLKQYTDYYLQLHTIQHVLDLTYRIFKQALKTKNEIILEGAPNFIEQLVYLLIFFNDINSLEHPKIPFLPKTKCWIQNKILIQKGLTTVVNIIKILISKNSVITEYYKNQQNNPHILEVIRMAEFFPSIKGCVLLFSIVYSLYNYKLSSKQEFNHYDLQCFISGLKSVSTIQKNFSQENQPYFNYDAKLLKGYLQSQNNQQKLGRVLKLQIYFLQFLCSFEGKKILNAFKSEGNDYLERYLNELKPLFEVCKKLESIRIKKNQNKQNMEDLQLVVNGKKIQQTGANLGQTENKEQIKQYKTIGNLDNFVSDFQSSVLLFINMISQYRSFADPILSNITFQFIVKNLSHLSLSNEAQFCFTASIHSLCKTNVCYDNIQRVYKDFSKDITQILYEGQISKSNLMPLFRSIRFLIQNRQKDSQYFREMIPKLREYADISSNKDFQQLKTELGKLEISAIGQTQNQKTSNYDENPQADNISFIDQKSFHKMMNPDGKKQSESFLNNEEMTFLQNMKDDNESAAQDMNETMSVLNKNKKVSEMSQVEKKVLFKEMFVKEARLLLKLLVVISENELQEKIKEMKLNKEFKIEGAGTLSKKTQKQQIDFEEKKKNFQQPYNDSQLYGLDMKAKYEDRLQWVPDYYKKSAYDLYEDRKRQKQQIENRDNEPIPIVKLKDDSDSTLIRIKNNQITDILDKKPDFMLENELNKSNSKFSPIKGHSQEPIARQNVLQNESIDFRQRNSQQVESLQQFMKQQQEKQYLQNQRSVKNILPVDLSSLSSIHLQDNQRSNQPYQNMNYPNTGSKHSSMNQTSHMFSNDYSVLKKSGQNILSDVDEIYKKMYEKKLNFQ